LIADRPGGDKPSRRPPQPIAVRGRKSATDWGRAGPRSSAGRAGCLACREWGEPRLDRRV